MKTLILVDRGRLVIEVNTGMLVGLFQHDIHNEHLYI